MDYCISLKQQSYVIYEVCVWEPKVLTALQILRYTYLRDQGCQSSPGHICLLLYTYMVIIICIYREGRYINTLCCAVCPINKEREIISGRNPPLNQVEFLARVDQMLVFPKAAL